MDTRRLPSVAFVGLAIVATLGRRWPTIEATLGERSKFAGVPWRGEGHITDETRETFKAYCPCLWWSYKVTKTGGAASPAWCYRPWSISLTAARDDSGSSRCDCEEQQQLTLSVPWYPRLIVDRVKLDLLAQFAASKLKI